MSDMLISKKLLSGSPNSIEVCEKYVRKHEDRRKEIKDTILSVIALTLLFGLFAFLFSFALFI